MAHDAFISYAHSDKAVADAACAMLEGAGIRCWIAPRDVPPGAQWAAAIVGAIEHCRVMVLIFSSEANLSVQIQREVERAVSKGIPLIPLRIEEVKPTSSMEYYLGSIHWLDALTPPLETHLGRLAEIVKACIDFNQGAAQPSSRPAEAQPHAKEQDGSAAAASLPQGRPGMLPRTPMRRRALVAGICLLLVVCIGAALLYVRYGRSGGAETTAESSDVERFDGIWIGTLVCSRTPTGQPGWRYQLVARVTDGHLRSQRGKEGQPGSETYDGAIKPDGTVEITQNGLSGDTETDPFHRPRGTEYHNIYAGRFEGSRGTLTRLDRASCNIEFVPQAEARGSAAGATPTQPR